MIVKELIVRVKILTTGLPQLNSALGRVRASAHQAGMGIGAMSTTGVQGLKRVEYQARRTGTALRGMTSYFLLFMTGRFIFNTIREFETLDAVLETVVGPNGNVAATVEMLRAFARETPSSFQEVENTFIRLSQMGENVTPEALRGIGNVAAAFRVDLDTMSRAVGKATIGNARELATALRSTVKVHGEMVEMMLGGEMRIVNRHDLVDYFIEIGNRSAEAGGFAGAMTNQMDTLSGSIEKLGDTVRFLIADIAKDEGLREALTGFVFALSDGATNGKSTARVIAGVLTSAIKGLTRALKIIEALLPVLEAGFKIWTASLVIAGMRTMTTTVLSLGNALRGTAASAGLMNAALLLIPLLIDDFMVFLQGGDSVLGHIFGQEKGPLIARFIEDLQDGVVSILELITRAVGDLGTALGEFFASLVPWIEGTGRDLITFFEELADEATKAYDAVAQSMAHDLVVRTSADLSDAQEELADARAAPTGWDSPSLMERWDNTEVGGSWDAAAQERMARARVQRLHDAEANLIHAQHAQDEATTALMAFTGQRQGTAAGLASDGHSLQGLRSRVAPLSEEDTWFSRNQARILEAGRRETTGYDLSSGPAGAMGLRSPTTNTFNITIDTSDTPQTILGAVHDAMDALIEQAKRLRPEPG